MKANAMLLSNNPQLDAEQLESRLRQLSEFRRRDDAAAGAAPASVLFEQEAISAIVALAAAPVEPIRDAAASDPAPDPATSVAAGSAARAQHVVAVDPAPPAAAGKTVGRTAITPDRPALPEPRDMQATSLHAAPEIAKPASLPFLRPETTVVPPSNSAPPPRSGVLPSGASPGGVPPSGASPGGVPPSGVLPPGGVPPSGASPGGVPPRRFSLVRKLKGVRAWLANLRHLNSRFAMLNARLQAEDDAVAGLCASVAALQQLPARIDLLETLPARVAGLETLPGRLDALEALPARIDALERLQIRIDRLETLFARIDAVEDLSGQVQYLHDSALAQHESNRGVFLRLDAQDHTNQGVQDRIGWLEALKTGNRLGQLEHLNLATRLNRLDALDISNRLNAWDMTNVANRLHKLDQHKIGERLQKLDVKLKTVLDRNLERDNRIAALVQKFRTVPALLKPAAPGASPAALDAAPATTLTAADIDQFYVEFEGLFRGAPEEIRERLKVYLPYIEKLAADPDALAIDIGCGRGEWLGLLHEAGVRALGIDSNAAMVALCSERGLRAECADAIVWLQAQPAGSVALISGFHLIEHLPFETLLALFDAALNALRPGGMLIFETPNPENLVVGACHFYYDPTHRNPIVPAVAEFMARQRGFARAEILRVNAYPDSYLLDEDSEAAIRINRAFYSAQDFALLAWKSHAA